MPLSLATRYLIDWEKADSPDNVIDIISLLISYILRFFVLELLDCYNIGAVGVKTVSSRTIGRYKAIIEAT